MFRKAYEEADAEAVFVVTLSNHLSGCYNSAVLAKKLYEEELAETGKENGKKILVLDSLSASSGELNIALYIQSLCEAGDRKSTRLNSSHIQKSRMPSSA